MAEVAVGLDADEGHHVEPELQGVRDRDHVEHARIGQPLHPGAHGRLGYAKLTRDGRVGAAALALEDLNDPAVDRVKLYRGITHARYTARTPIQVRTS